MRRDGVNLAPDTYARAARAYRSAEKKFSEARSLDAVQRDLDKSTKGFKQAEFVAELAQTKLGNMLKARTDAKQVEAEKFSARVWQRAETAYRSALNNNEDGRPKSALRQAESATKLYREVELTAIKTIYLAETGMLITTAEKQSAKRYAPETLAKAKDLLRRAEIELTENRYDTDLPRSLAREATVRSAPRDPSHRLPEAGEADAPDTRIPDPGVGGATAADCGRRRHECRVRRRL